MYVLTSYTIYILAQYKPINTVFFVFYELLLFFAIILVLIKLNTFTIKTH